MATLRSTSVVAPTGNVNPSSDPPVIAAPAGLAAGDLLVVAVFFAQALAASNTVVVPSGMTRVSYQGDSPARLGAVYAAVVEDPATFAGGISLGGNATSTRVAAVAAAFEPDANHTFTLGDVTYTGPEWNGSSMADATYPAGATGDLVLGIAMTNKGASTTLSEHSPVGGGTIAAQARAVSAASGSVSDSVTSISVGGTGVSFNINQANGITFSVGVTEVEGDDDPEPELPDVTGHGFVSVQQMLQTPGATFAHRNLGLTYPEMTEYGVRMAANAGFGVIEVSCQRSSDGVWFGAHDQTPDRIAVETTYDGQQFSSLTWAQISSLTINVGSTGAPRPFATLTELVETLPEDFVFMVDPKQQGATYINEFLDLVDTLLGPTRAIIKIDGSATANRFQAAKARGYVTAAYYYAAPATPTNPTNVANNIDYVDIPGLNYDATQEGWNDFLAYGKPMWGHVCLSQSDVNTAMSKGATFTQCSSATITPVGVESWVPPEDAPPVHLGDTPLRGIALGETEVLGAYLGDAPLWGG